MYVVFDESGLGSRAVGAPEPGDSACLIDNDLYLEIQANPFVLRELTLRKIDGRSCVERVTNFVRLNQTMQPVAEGRGGDVVLRITWTGMSLEYATHVKKVDTHEFSFCLDSPLLPLCDPVKLSHGTSVQMEHILPQDSLVLRAELFRRCSVFVSRPYVGFTYSYYLDSLLDF